LWLWVHVYDILPWVHPLSRAGQRQQGKRTTMDCVVVLQQNVDRFVFAITPKDRKSVETLLVKLLNLWLTIYGYSYRWIEGRHSLWQEHQPGSVCRRPSSICRQCCLQECQVAYWNETECNTDVEIQLDVNSQNKYLRPKFFVRCFLWCKHRMCTLPGYSLQVFLLIFGWCRDSNNKPGLSVPSN